MTSPRESKDKSKPIRWLVLARRSKLASTCARGVAKPTRKVGQLHLDPFVFNNCRYYDCCCCCHVYQDNNRYEVYADLSSTLRLHLPRSQGKTQR